MVNTILQNKNDSKTSSHDQADRIFMRGRTCGIRHKYNEQTPELKSATAKKNLKFRSQINY